MNWSIYEAMDRIPLGVAVTIEFGARSPWRWSARAARSTSCGSLLAAPASCCSPAPAAAASTPAASRSRCSPAAAGPPTSASRRAPGRRSPAARGCAIAMAVGAVVVLPAGIAQGGAALGPGLLASALVVALASSVLPYSLELEALRRLPGAVFGVLMSLEPAVAALAGLACSARRWCRASGRRSPSWSPRAPVRPRSEAGDEGGAGVMTERELALRRRIVRRSRRPASRRSSPTARAAEPGRAARRRARAAARAAHPHGAPVRRSSRGRARRRGRAHVVGQLRRDGLGSSPRSACRRRR